MISSLFHCNRLAAFGTLTAIGVISLCMWDVSGHYIHRVERILGMFNIQYAADEHASMNQSLNNRQLFPADDPWNSNISKEQVDPNSDILIASIGSSKPLHPDFGTRYSGEPWGIPYMVVAGDQPKVAIIFSTANESDPGPYPIPFNAPIEGGPKSDGDRHVLIIDKDNWMLYELFGAFRGNAGAGWTAGSGAIFDLKKKSVQRPVGWTSADAAGLPILVGLARYEEIADQGKLTHALRFSAPHTRRAFVYPATHVASSSRDTNLPPMGMRVRLKGDYDISRFPAVARVILQGLQTYGMILADNGGSWFISGAPDPRWNDQQLETLKSVRGSDFEVVRMAEIKAE